MAYAMGVVGLGVMGANLARNIESRGFAVAGYDLDAAKTAAFLAGPARGRAITGADSPAALMEVLERPRRVLMMVPAGAAVDSVIAHLRPHLQEGDILIDGGNSFFQDTDRRSDELTKAGLRFVGTGVSGGEEGALKGPSIMPGGEREAWEAVAPVFRAIAARAEDGEPCVDYMGPRGAGHYVKMVHNGIEYGDMQLIAEAYDLLHRGAGMEATELAAVFTSWNEGELRSYLIEITAKVLERTDEETGRPLVDVILDEAQQKGTGKWMSQNAFDVGAPIPTVNAAVEARILSALKAERVAASRVLPGPSPDGRAGRGLVDDVRQAFARDAGLVNLLLDPAFTEAVASRQEAWRRVVQAAVGLGLPVPAMSASLAYYDAYRSARLPANLTQGQRDFFGAHTYRRVDKDGVFHTDWAAAPAGGTQ